MDLMPLESRYADELTLLKELFDPGEVQRKLPRLNEIFQRTEAKWHDYIEQIPKRHVNYLLIAESPPWSSEGPPQYVLDAESRSRTLLQALRAAFLPPSAAALSPQDVLAELAQRGWLIADSIPFAMDYLRRRRRKSYRDLVSRTVRTYLDQKLQQSSINWSDGIRVAFSVKLNGTAVISALGERLNLGQVTVPLELDLIAVNRAGYPDAKALKRVYGLGK